MLVKTLFFKINFKVSEEEYKVENPGAVNVNCDINCTSFPPYVPGFDFT